MEVKAKAGLIEMILTALTDLQDRINSEKLFQTGQRKSYVSKLENASKKVEHAQAAAESGNAKRANNQLSAGSQILGALLNQLAGQQNGQGDKKGKKDNSKGSSSSDGTARRTLQSEAKTRIDQIQLAIEAEI